MSSRSSASESEATPRRDSFESGSSRRVETSLSPASSRSSVVSRTPSPCPSPRPVAGNSSLLSTTGGTSSGNQTPSQLLTQLRELVESELKCAICQQLIHHAVNINCSHTFCSGCFTQWRNHNGQCPVCRENYSNRSRVLLVDNLIDRYCQLFNIKRERRSPNTSPAMSTASSAETNESWGSAVIWPDSLTRTVAAPSVRNTGMNTSPISSSRASVVSSNSGSQAISRQSVSSRSDNMSASPVRHDIVQRARRLSGPRLRQNQTQTLTQSRPRGRGRGQSRGQRRGARRARAGLRGRRGVSLELQQLNDPRFRPRPRPRRQQQRAQNLSSQERSSSDEISSPFISSTVSRAQRGNQSRDEHDSSDDSSD
ncbi:uncharacterized protein LOC128393659 [Panonychus citri]|uniref:uncharacterized protein LOC128393659 n=1 Tax=Panonychus citri TaxID=50023 RepID=UPI002306DD36|nr:uncharacterized protein LOC128393659 [Panonychus citri]